jgi:hypothetical protein
MISLSAPQTLSGTTEQKFNQLYSYLFQTSNRLNVALSSLTVENIWKQTSEALATANSANVSLDTQDAISGYQAIKNLIVKTADYALLSMEQMSVNLNSEYEAVSDYGKFLEKASVTINGNAYGITQLYNYTTNLSSEYHDYTTDTSQYIKTGLLYHDGATPKYGLEIGILSNEITVDGERVTFDKQYRTQITADKWSLYSDDDEVLYISGTAAYMPNAIITGGSLNINSNFTVDSAGTIMAKSGTVGGWTIDTSSIYHGTVGYSSSAFFTTVNVETTLASQVKSNWRFGVGSNFGVDSDGYVYATGAHISGAVNASSGSFANCTINNTCTVGNWSITNGAIVNGKTSLSSTDEGIYIGADGIYLGNASTGFKVTRLGYVTCNAITATGGQIGSWSINSAYLGSVGTTDSFFISSASDSSGTGSSYWISAFSGSTRKFSVSKTGAIYATSGSVGNCDIVDGNLVVNMAYVTGKLLGENISAHTITSNEIMANTITAAEIEAGTITGTEIKASSIGADKLIAIELTATLATLGFVTAETLVAKHIDVTGAATIAGWSINEHFLGTVSGNSGFYISSAGDASTSWIRALNSSGEVTFAVNRTGLIYAKGGYFKGEVQATSGKFKGTIEAEDGYFYGSINASDGTIGGFRIGASSLKCGSYSPNGAYCVMQEGSGSTGTAFAAGSSSESSYSDAKFRVTMGGTLYANDAVISGNITSSNANITGGNIELTAPTKSTPRLSIRYNSSNYITAFPNGIGVRDNGYDNVAIGSDGTAGFLSLRNTGTSSVFISGNISATSYINSSFTVNNVFKVKSDDDNYVVMNGGTINIVKDGSVASIVSGTGVITATVRLQSGSSSLGTGMIQLGYGLDGYNARPCMRFTHASSNGYLWMDQYGNLKYRKNGGSDITIA